MTRFMVYGASDDLLEIREIGRYPNEILKNGKEYDCWDSSEERPVEVTFSDGTILNVWHGDDTEGAIWKIKVKEQGSVGTPGAGVVIVPAESEEGIYSDVAFVTAPEVIIEKVVYKGEVIEG